MAIHSLVDIVPETQYKEAWKRSRAGGAPMAAVDTVPKGGEFLISAASGKDVFTPEDFTDEQKQLGETTRQFVVNEVLPNVEKLENHDFTLMVRLLKRAGELGLLM